MLWGSADDGDKDSENPVFDINTQNYILYLERDTPYI